MTTERPYHHGDLPNALKAAAVGLIVEQGPSGFSLREVARRAGVSHAAPAHHFGDRDGLLRAVAHDGFVALREAMEGLDPRADPVERLLACGRSYVRLAREMPGHWAVMWRDDLYANEPGDDETALACYATLELRVGEALSSIGSDADPTEASFCLWALVQGLGELSSTMAGLAALRSPPDPALGDPEVLAERFTRQYLAALAAGPKR
jgi:AcrR family transcriptional regulator